MSQNELQVKVLSPDRIIFRGAARSLGLPGELGYMTLLPGHASMVASLDIGVLALEKEVGATEKLFLAGGFVDVGPQGITVLADVVEKPAEISVDRAKKSLARAEDRLGSRKVGAEAVDVPRALAAKKRAQFRLELSGAAKSAH